MCNIYKNNQQDYAATVHDKQFDIMKILNFGFWQFKIGFKKSYLQHALDCLAAGCDSTGTGIKKKGR